MVREKAFPRVEQPEQRWACVGVVEQLASWPGKGRGASKPSALDLTGRAGLRGWLGAIISLILQAKLPRWFVMLARTLRVCEILPISTFR